MPNVLKQLFGHFFCWYEFAFKGKDNSFNIKYFCGEVNLEYFLAEGIFV